MSLTRPNLILPNIDTAADTSMNSPFRYAGGKFYARKLILEWLPPHLAYLEPFAGGASIFFAKGKVGFNWLNDADKELMNCYRCIQEKPDELVDFLVTHGAVASKELHKYFKNVYAPTTEIERAGRWYYLNRTSYSGIMNTPNCYWGYGDKYSKRPENWPRTIMEASRKLQGVRLTDSDFEPVIDGAPDGAFLFIDPPYYNADQDKFYTCAFALSDHERLLATLKRNSHRLMFLLTYDDSEDIRAWYSWCNRIEAKEWNYTINRTDDQAGKTDRKGKRYKGQELFIANY